MDFVEALKNENITEIRKSPKSDLHNHFVLGGNRQFILCTNNENNICEDITYQRIKTVITGKRKDESKYSEGIRANLKYYKCTYIQ